MTRGEQIIRECDRASACSNCGNLRFLKFLEPTRFGIHGRWFCQVAYRETGDFESQPWDFTCEDFKQRGRHRDGQKRIHPDEVPVVAAMEEWEDELVHQEA
jgi:hypothetical protein